MSPRNAEICAAFARGESIKDLAERHGISRGRVAQIVRWVELPPRKAKAKAKAEAA